MKPILLKSKLAIPRLDQDVLQRPGLKLTVGNIQQYSVTVVFAGAGYGKTTAVVQALESLKVPCCWYNPGPEDDNIFAFSAYLAGALEHAYPGFQEWYFASMEQESQLNWKTAFAIFMAGMENYDQTAAVLVIDDWHLVHKDTEIQQFFDRFLACKPAGLHVVMLSREKVNLPELSRLQVSGKLLEIQNADLMFRYEETCQFMSRILPDRYTMEDIRRIYDLTEGWIMVIRLFANAGSHKMQPSGQPEEIEALFDYLAHDVLVRQTLEVQNFLLQSAILDSFTVKACQAVLGEAFRYEYLDSAFKRGLFLSEVGKGTYRYHQLFREFLIQEAARRVADLPSLYRRAGQYYLQCAEMERALYYFILGGNSAQSIDILSGIARDLVRSGRSRRLHHFLAQLPEAKSRTDIILALGDEARFACQYKNAIALYEKAAAIYHEERNGLSESSALLGIGETYLDIIQPLQADSFLRRAYKVLPAGQSEARAAILILMAENMINQGSPIRAERYIRLARNKIHFEDNNNLEARILLRTGRLQEVIDLKTQEVPLEKNIYHVPCSFRESPLILSICYVYTGQAAEALAAAKQGIEIGDQMGSPFISAVGYARLGHALLIQPNPDLEQCWSAYRQSLAISSTLDIPRSRTEVLQGQALLHALAGDWPSAEKCGCAGIAITEKCCDRWFTAVLYHTLGMSAALCKHYSEAALYLQKGFRLFRLCGDHFGQASAAWWETYVGLCTGQEDAFATSYRMLRALCREYHCEFLLERPSLLGDIANFSTAPFVMEARRLEISDTVDRTIEAGSTARLNFPAAPVVQMEKPYKLRIQTFGELKVWREGELVTPSGWRRESSRQLFALLLATRHEPVHKDTLLYYLWPESDILAASRNFKVALSNLMIVLEPNRQPRQACSFIQRQGTVYRFNLSAEYYLDSDEFESLTKQALSWLQQNPGEAKRVLQKAISLYQGDYLNCDLQNELVVMERERLSGLFIQAAESLIRLCMQQNRYEEALHWADVLLRHDKCWEQAYQLKMQCYGNLQNIPMVVRTYKKCCTVLQEELCVQQSDKTKELYAQLVSNPLEMQNIGRQG